MIVLLTGASGFVGSHLLAALHARGHEVVTAVRNRHVAAQTVGRCVEADFTRDFDPQVWLPRLAGVDVVINAVGILRERGRQTFDAVHVRAPLALFAACAIANVRVIQISALGADQAAASAYHLSKRKADDGLLEVCRSAVIVQPSLVYGADGTSAKLFTLLASLPLIPVPGRGEQRIQPIHIEDVAGAIVKLVEVGVHERERVPLVGPAPTTLRDFLRELRSAMGMGHAAFVSVPLPVVAFGAHFAKLLPGSLLDTETLQMLTRGNTASPAATTELLGRAPRPVASFISAKDARAVRTRASLSWLAPLLRWSIAAVWIVTGIVSIAFYPVEDSYALLARVGISGALAAIALYGAGVLDLIFGVAILVATRRRPWWIAQALVILGYTALITWRLPEFWLHPYGPILKNLPMLAAIWLLYELDER